jgi:hypothetical protein
MRFLSKMDVFMGNQLLLILSTKTTHRLLCVVLLMIK